MARNKRNTSSNDKNLRKNVNKRNNGRRRQTGGGGGGASIALDARGRAYARLLADPCNAPPAYGVGIGSGGGTLVRYTTDFGTTIVTAGDTSGAVAFTPGLFQAGGTPSGSNPCALMYKSAATGVDVSTWNGSYPQQPGYNDLNANPGKLRVLAACMQVFYPGAEGTRQGVWGIGLVPTTMIDFANATSAASTMSVLPNLRRVDEKMLEVKWAPGSEDTDWVSTQRTIVGVKDFAPECNSMVVAWTGLPANQILQVRCTLVCEVVRVSQYSLKSTAYVPPPVNTMAQVLNYLHNKEPNWMLKVTDAAWGLGSAALSLL